MKHVNDPQELSFRLSGARVAVLGYGPIATEHARGLRDAGNEVSVGSGGMSGVRARKDGFPAKHAVSVVEGASVVVVLVPDEEQSSVYWAAIEPNIATTTIAAEVDSELAALETRAGSAAAYRDEVEHAAARASDSHAPEEARVKFYEGLRELLDARAARAGAPAPGERGSAVSLVSRNGARRGMP